MDENLTTAERDALVVAARNNPDPFLYDLGNYADNGMALGVGLLVNGMVVLGTLGRPEQVADDLSAARASAFRLADKPEEMSDEEWAETEDKFVNDPCRQVEKYREEQAAIDDELASYDHEGDPTNLPQELGRRAVGLSVRSHLTLTDVSIIAGGTPGSTSVPVLRVAVAHVTAWWMLKYDENGKSATRLWAD